MGKTFRDWDIEQLMMFPPSVEDFVPQGHVAHFVRSTVSEALDLSAIVDCYNEERGYPPYHPVMMTALLLYAYCQGIYPSRRIAKACRERVDFMAVTGMQTPDFRTISDFRKRHMAAKKGEEKKSGGPGRPRKNEPGTPKDSAQTNFTDPQSRIMKSHDGFIQGYNAQAVVDADSQVIVAQGLTNNASDAQQLAVMVAHIKQNTGRQARELSADAGYCSEDNLKELRRRHINGYIATGRQKHGQATAAAERNVKLGTYAYAMWQKLRRGGHRSRYRLRKQTVEPVFGQVKQGRGFRQFLLRGLRKVAGEWSLICTP